MNKVYILQKDTPELKAGAEFTSQFHSLLEDFIYICKLSDGHETHYHKEVVENNPEWFLLKEDVELSKAKELLLDNGYEIVKDGAHTISTKGQFHSLSYKFDYSKDDVNTIFGELNSLRLIHKAYKAMLEKNPGLKRNEKLYTEDDMRLCFKAGLDSAIDTKAFECYIKSL